MLSLSRTLRSTQAINPLRSVAVGSPLHWPLESPLTFAAEDDFPPPRFQAIQQWQGFWSCDWVSDHRIWIYLI